MIKKLIYAGMLFTILASNTPIFAGPINGVLSANKTETYRLQQEKVFDIRRQIVFTWAFSPFFWKYFWF